MTRNLHLEIMGVISEVLSVSTEDLRKRLDVKDDELDRVLEEMEREGLLMRTHDSVRNEDFFAPTSKGILQSRRAYKHAF